jgi:hypothetical protein
VHLTEEAFHTRAYLENTPRVIQALDTLDTEFSDDFVDKSLLKESLNKDQLRFTIRLRKHEETVKPSSFHLVTFLMAVVTSDFIHIGDHRQAYYTCA